MTAIFFGTVFLLGLAVGSFCNVVIYRLKAGDSPVRGRSYCPHCKHTLGAKDLVPLLSFVKLRGKCRYCKKPISWQYPLVEAALAILAVLVVARYGLSPESLFGLILAAFFTIIFVYDLRYKLILDKVSLPAAAVALLGSLIIGRSPLMLLLAVTVGGGFFLLQYLLSRGTWIGGGDIRLGAVLGLALGWPLVLVALVMSYLMGAAVTLPLLLSKRRSLTSLIPFGTFLTVAGLVTFLYGNELLNWYLHGGFFDFVVRLLPDPKGY